MTHRGITNQLSPFSSQADALPGHVTERTAGNVRVAADMRGAEALNYRRVMPGR